MIATVYIISNLRGTYCIFMEDKLEGITAVYFMYHQVEYFISLSYSRVKILYFKLTVKSTKFCPSKITTLIVTHFGINIDVNC